MLEQVGELVVNVEGLDDVVVLQDEDDVVGEVGDVVEQFGDEGCRVGRGGRGGMLLQPLQLVGAQAWGRVLERGEHVGTEPTRLVVRGVKRQPRDG